MQTPKDNFSRQAGDYARFRPRYPDALYDFLLSLTPSRGAAWDAGTGNGQVAGQLANAFGHVYATDISAKQLEKAPPRENVTYRVCRAESTGFPDHTFDLVTVAQALHWFDFGAFYAEVGRVARPGGVLAVWGYNLLHVEPAVDALVRTFYRDVVGPYWDAERRHVEAAYATIPFPFPELPAPPLRMVTGWEREHLLGYLNTWSAVQGYKQANGTDPVEALRPRLEAIWPAGETREVQFPLFVRAGRVGKWHSGGPLLR
ncbi:MAG: SAM-dependent methyltransferase [uncultured Cytophagales bacterium]|uniref:SAM-dependent methyltransferase n=1 Tax=uncultured Cytophagales bacterium TaxID=158755 RepID=A0A6J4HN12_9SPHI|nr:MAG: SAM-dependent methyltransferase [uncultured Cytophagales bacterium]